MIKKCPKCNAEFVCGNNEISACHCVSVTVSSEAKQYLVENYKDCLCNTCLREVAERYTPDKNTNKNLGE